MIQEYFDPTAADRSLAKKKETIILIARFR